MNVASNVVKHCHYMVHISYLHTKNRFKCNDENTFEPWICFQYRQFELRPARGQNALKLRLCDTMGLEEKDGLSIGNVPYILDGHIQNGFKVNHLLSWKKYFLF